MKYSEYNDLGCGCNNGLSDLTDQEALNIIQDHFKTLPLATSTTIAVGLTTGNTVPLANEVKKVTEKICVAGSKAKLTDFVTSPIGIGLGVLLLGGVTYYAVKK